MEEFNIADREITTFEKYEKLAAASKKRVQGKGLVLCMVTSQLLLNAGKLQ